MVHRKRPHLVPIFDSKVAAFYATTARTPWVLRPRLQHDIRATTDQIDEFRRRFYEPFVGLHPRRREWFALDDASAMARRAEQGEHVVAQLHRVGSEFRFVPR